MSDAFGQLSAVCAVLGGFAVTFLGIVLTLADVRKRVEVVVVIATACAACFFLGALGWALLAALAARAASSTSPRPRRNWRSSSKPQACCGARSRCCFCSAWRCCSSRSAPAGGYGRGGWGC